MPLYVHSSGLPLILGLQNNLPCAGQAGWLVGWLVGFGFFVILLLICFGFRGAGVGVICYPFVLI